MPTAQSSVYTVPIFIVTTNTIINAIAVAEGKAPSDLATSNPFVIQACQGGVTFTAEGQKWGEETSSTEGFVEESKIQMNCTTQGATIYCTLDGSVPNVMSAVYNSIEAIMAITRTVRGRSKR